MAMKSMSTYEAFWRVAADHVEHKNPQHLELGGNQRIGLTLDVTNSAKRTKNVVFHSINPQYKLIDFMYQDSVGVFHAFQVTLGKSHSANPRHIKELHNDVGLMPLRLYYLVPDTNFKDFVTDPVSPVPYDSMKEYNSIKVYHVMIPNPSKKQATATSQST
jgi:hypothetical protein